MRLSTPGTGFAVSALLFAALTTSACSKPSASKSATAQRADREELYAELSLLESTLTPPLTSFMTEQDGTTAISWIRAPGVLTPAEDEFARTRRILALEQLAAQIAPESTAEDYAAFWEIHQAYRFAVETGRFGYGKPGLVYTRPYAGDYLSGPLALLLTLSDPVNIEPTVGAPPEETIRRDIRELALRLDVDRASGNTMHPQIIQRMLDLISASPFADSSALDRAVAALASPPDSVEANSFGMSARDYLTPEMLSAVSALRAKLEVILADWQTDKVPSTYSRDFHTQVMAQAASPDFPPAQCASRAQALRAETEAAMTALMDTALSVDETTAIPTLSPDASLNDRFLAWQQAAPLLLPLPEPDPETTDAAVSPAPALAPAPTEPAIAEPPHSEAYRNFATAWDHVQADWQVLFSKRLTSPEIIETDVPQQPLPGRYARPKPLEPKSLLARRLPHRSSGETISISAATLEGTPASLAITDLLMAYGPGRSALPAMHDFNPSQPALAETLPIPAFDLGWPYFALAQMSDRNAFERTPRIEFARLYRLNQMLKEAETDAYLALGSTNYDEALSHLMTDLGMSDAEARSSLDRLLVEPGLGCATLSGFTSFRALESRAKGVLGARFNVRAFNDQILKHGSRPLSLVEMNVDIWISASVGGYDPNPES